MSRLRSHRRRRADGVVLLPCLAGVVLLPCLAGVLASLIGGVLTGVLATGPALASSPDKAMLLLEPTERMEQRCNARAMGEVGRQHPALHPDELVAYAFAETRIVDEQVTAPGAAVRSGGHWYHLSYHCVTKNEGLGIEALTYVLGDVIPRDQWEAHGLVP